MLEYREQQASIYIVKGFTVCFCVSRQLYIANYARKLRDS